MDIQTDTTLVNSFARNSNHVLYFDELSTLPVFRIKHRHDSVYESHANFTCCIETKKNNNKKNHFLGGCLQHGASSGIRFGYRRRIFLRCLPRRTRNRMTSSLKSRCSFL